VVRKEGRLFLTAKLPCAADVSMKVPGSLALYNLEDKILSINPTA
jgi:hypothetical protein